MHVNEKNIRTTDASKLKIHMPEHMQKHMPEHMPKRLPRHIPKIVKENLEV